MRLALVLVPIVCWAAPSEARRDPIGQLDLQVSVPDAEITIDGNVLGRSPLAAPLRLKAGKHTVKVTRTGHAEFLDVVTIKTGEMVVLEVDLLPLAAAVTLTSRPSGAIITVDGEAVGKTPWTGEVLPGQKKLRLSLDGYLDSERQVEVLAGASYDYKFELVREPPPVPEPGAERKRRPLYKKWWFWAAAATVVVGTTAIIVFATGDDPFADAERVVMPEW